MLRHCRGALCLSAYRGLRSVLRTSLTARLPYYAPQGHSGLIIFLFVMIIRLSYFALFEGSERIYFHTCSRALRKRTFPDHDHSANDDHSATTLFPFPAFCSLTTHEPDFLTTKDTKTTKKYYFCYATAWHSKVAE